MDQEKPAITKKQTLMQAIKFTLFSCSAGIIQIAAFTLLNEMMDWPYWPSYLIGLTLSVVYNFTINRKFTFKTVANVPVAMMKIIAYYCVFTPISTVIGNYCEETLGVNEYLILGVTMLCNLATEFLVYRIFVYRNSMYTNKEGVRELEKLAAEKGEAVQENEKA